MRRIIRLISGPCALSLAAQRKSWFTETVDSADALETTEPGCALPLPIPHRSLPGSQGPPFPPHNHCLPQGRLLFIILCSLGFSGFYILLCCWACLPFCLALCLDPHLSINSRPTVPGPLHFSGYSSVPDGKVS